MKEMWILTMICTLSACASDEVRCDGRLQPINLPRPRIAAPATQADPAAPTRSALPASPSRSVP